MAGYEATSATAAGTLISLARHPLTVWPRRAVVSGKASSSVGEGYVIAENRIVKRLRGVAGKLTSDPELQKDLMQEMFIHLLRVQVECPKRTLSWYIKSCEFQARNWLKHGRSVDSLKRARSLVSLGQDSEDDGCNRERCVDAADPVDLEGELITQDIVNLIVPQLTETQQHILFLLMKGFRVREIAREMSISHPAVIKHRKRIARIAHEFLTESSRLPCSAGNGNGGQSEQRVSAR